MTFLWPYSLYLLGLIPLIIVAYILDAATTAAFCGTLFQPGPGA